MAHFATMHAIMVLLLSRCTQLGAALVFGHVRLAWVLVMALAVCCCAVRMYMRSVRAAERLPCCLCYGLGGRASVSTDCMTLALAWSRWWTASA